MHKRHWMRPSAPVRSAKTSPRRRTKPSKTPARGTGWRLPSDALRTRPGKLCLELEPDRWKPGFRENRAAGSVRSPASNQPKAITLSLASGRDAQFAQAPNFLVGRQNVIDLVGRHTLTHDRKQTGRKFLNGPGYPMPMTRHGDLLFSKELARQRA